MNAAGMRYCEMKWQKVIKCPGFDQSVSIFLKGNKLLHSIFDFHHCTVLGSLASFSEERNTLWKPHDNARLCQFQLVEWISEANPIDSHVSTMFNIKRFQTCSNLHFPHVFSMFFQLFQFHSLPVWQGHRPLHAAARLKKCIPRILTRAHVRGKLRLALRWWGRLRQRNASGAHLEIQKTVRKRLNGYGRIPSPSTLR